MQSKWCSSYRKLHHFYNDSLIISYVLIDEILTSIKFCGITFQREAETLDFRGFPLFLVTNLLLAILQGLRLPSIHQWFYGCKLFHRLPLIYAPSSDQCRLYLHRLNPTLTGKYVGIRAVYGVF